MPKDIFQFIKNAFEKAEPVPTSGEGTETFMVIKYLSLYPGSFRTAEKANRLASKLPNWALNCFLHYNTPPVKRAPFIKYPKKEKEPNDKALNEVLAKIGQHYCCSKEHARQILTILSEERDVYAAFGIKK